MSTKVVIGRGMTEPFAIPQSAKRVSSRHAEIEIDDQGEWTLTDLNSTNGTYIKDESGNLVQVGRSRITRDTVIVLADMTINGFQFRADSVISGISSNYGHQFIRLQKERDRIDEELEKVYQTSKYVKYIPSLLIVVVMFLISMFIEPEHRFMLMGAVSAVCTALVSAVYDPQTRLRRITERRKHKLVCPNPQCGKQLTDYEIDRGQCSACKAH